MNAEEAKSFIDKSEMNESNPALGFMVIPITLKDFEFCPRLVEMGRDALREIASIATNEMKEEYDQCLFDNGFSQGVEIAEKTYKELHNNKAEMKK